MKVKSSLFVFVPPILSICVFAIATPSAPIYPLIVLFCVAAIAAIFIHLKFPWSTKFNPASKIQTAFVQVSAKLIAFLDRRQKRLIAKRFNNRYTYRKEWIEGTARISGTSFGGPLPRGGYAWMCPDCNKIHQPRSSSVMSGLQYPACCTTSEGHRLDHGIR